MIRVAYVKYLTVALVVSVLVLTTLYYSSTPPPPPQPPPQYFTHLLILIVSTPAHHYNRTLIRDSGYVRYPWRDTRTGKLIQFRYLFVLGQSGNVTVDNAVSLEAAQYNDIIRGSFYDSYDTLTNKVMWAFEYSVKRFLFDFCLKVDEDTFVNIEYLNEYLKSVSLFNKSYNSFYAGKPRQGNLTISKEGKFKLEAYEHNLGNEFVRYNLGGGYILSRPMMNILCAVHRAGIVAPIKWEDVYIGVLAYLAGATPTRIYHYYVSKYYPFCTDAKTILLHHTTPLLQAKTLTYWHENRLYCPKLMTEDAVQAMYKDIEITMWGQSPAIQMTTALMLNPTTNNIAIDNTNNLVHDNTNNVVE